MLISVILGQAGIGSIKIQKIPVLRNLSGIRSRPYQSDSFYNITGSDFKTDASPLCGGKSVAPPVTFLISHERAA